MLAERLPDLPSFIGIAPESGRPELPAAQTLRRGLAILRLLARSHSGALRISEIGRRLGLSKPTAVRLAQALADEGFLSQDPGNPCYRLGPEAYAIGIAAEPNYAIQRVAAPVLQTLAAESGDAACFSIREGSEAVCLSLANGRETLPPGAMRIGDRYPLGISSAGLAILSVLPDAEVRMLLEFHGGLIGRMFPLSPAHLIPEAASLARRRGYAVVAGSLLPGYGGIGVPVLSPDGSPVASLSIVASEARLGPLRCAVLGERMRQLSAQLTSSA
jgi:DNA-binding IclR family transcriptional regulator